MSALSELMLCFIAAMHRVSCAKLMLISAANYASALKSAMDDGTMGVTGTEQFLT